MKRRLLGLAMVMGVALPLAAQAQMLQPGLWELTSSNMKVDDQNLPDLSLILGQLQQQMTPQQRAMLEKQGIKYTWYESPGTAHEWLTWRRDLQHFAGLIFK